MSVSKLNFCGMSRIPSELRYVFAYTITIENRGYAKSRLLNRHWLITNGDGYQETVEGPRSDWKDANA